ncbi:MAG: LPS-assembly protein LptD [Tannerellaceae bacterium]|nr:LPS-assembly protein LptD [Tannerellaceae bacterium]
MFLKYRLLHILFIFLSGSWFMQAQEVVALPDSIEVADSLSLLPADSLIISDSLNLSVTDSVDVASVDSVAPGYSTALDAPVEYEAQDSIVMTAGNWAYLFGEGNVKYQQIELEAENIEMNLDSSIVFAKFGLDSIGEEFGFPLFTDNGQQYESKTMRYNFNTKKGYITEVITQQGEGYVTSARTKKMEDDILNMVGGKYTTCDQHDHPHFYIQMTKAKVRPKKNIVTGPVYLVIEDVPLPLGLPFAFFPFSESYSSGVIFPSFGDESARGFFLRDAGYYFAISDYVDLAVTGDIYTKGSWAFAARSTYRKRYKFSGSFDTKYVVTKYGDKGLADYSLNKDFKITWTHSQDAKANPYRTFSASVNFATSSYNRNELQSVTNYNNTNNSKGSSVSISQRFPNSPFTLSATMTINQTARDSSIAVTLPDFTASMSRIYPFKRKQRIGKEKWFEKISLQYNGIFRNSITTKENLLFQSNLLKDWNNGIQHKASSSATFSLFKYINISPSVDYTERWYTSKIERAYDMERNAVIDRDTTTGFYRIYNYNASVSASTTLYGFFTPLPFLGNKVKMIRHRMEPSVSFGYAPDFGDPRYGYYKSYIYTNAAGDDVEYVYSPFANGMYGVPGSGRQGNVSFSLDNNIEMKIRSDRDSTGERKISLIDKLGFNMSYNMVADSFKWSDLTVNLRLKLTKSYTVNLTGVFDTYTYSYDPDRNTLTRRNVPRWQAGKGLGRLRSTGTSFSYTFNNDTFKKLFGGRMGDPSNPTGDPNEVPPEDLAEGALPEDDTPVPGSGRRMRGESGSSGGEMDADGYYINTFPWSLSFSYSMSLQYDQSRINTKTHEYYYKLNHALSFNGSLQPTKNWRLNFNATYDFEEHKISYLTCNITRNMHCFQMTASVIPVGTYKSYFFSVAVSSALLKDLKYDKRSNYRDGQSWY